MSRYSPASPSPTRRRLLRAGALGLATGLAGCSAPFSSEPAPQRDPIEPPTDNQDPTDRVETGDDDDSPTLSREPAAAFDAPDGKLTTNDYLTMDESPPSPADHRHPRERAFSITVDASTARLEMPPVRVFRDCTLHLHVRDTRGRFITKRASLTKSPNTQYRAESAEFGLSNVDLPRGAGGFVVLTLTDSEEERILGPDSASHHLLTRHQFVGIDHPDGTRWFNDAEFNDPDNSGGVMATEDHGDKRTVFLVCRTNVNDEVFGVATQVEKEFVETYRRKSDDFQWRLAHSGRWETHWATRISHLRDLAEKTDAVISAVGITGSFDRLQALGDLIQMAIPYGTAIKAANPPIVVLHEGSGDCSEVSMLIAGILANDPWNVRTAYIDCELRGASHMTVGIDERDFDGRGNIRWVDGQLGPEGNPRPDFPDTRYAFFEMTADTNLGIASKRVNKINGIKDTGTFEYTYDRSETPPDY